MKIVLRKSLEFYGIIEIFQKNVIVQENIHLDRESVAEEPELSIRRLSRIQIDWEKVT